MPRYLVSNLLGLAGAVVGGVVGFYTYKWLANQGIYGKMIPGALLGLGCGLFARHRSIPRGVACGIAALALSLAVEWSYFHSATTVTEFLTQVKDLGTVDLLMIGGATFIAFWLGKDAGYWSMRTSSPQQPPAS